MTYACYIRVETERLYIKLSLPLIIIIITRIEQYIGFQNPLSGNKELERVLHGEAALTSRNF